jgi:hypothetical protein
MTDKQTDRIINVTFHAAHCARRSRSGEHVAVGGTVRCALIQICLKIASKIAVAKPNVSLWYSATTRGYPQEHEVEKVQCESECAELTTVYAEKCRSMPSAQCTTQRRRFHVAVWNDKRKFTQILGNRIVQAKTEREDEGFLCLMIVRRRLTGCALVVVVDIYCCCQLASQYYREEKAYHVAAQTNCTQKPTQM